ncbi:MAG: phosphoglucosamine mutase [Candidatus Saganbacteria bacterium]|nr:phosphoglucosamine mutase [Candidatus Saganbacteria bacterium]
MALKISISGIRGIVGESLTEEVVSGISKAFGTYLKEGKVAVGCDTRRSSKPFKAQVLTGLAETGCVPVDLGICPTPTVGIAIKELKLSGGIMVTASHNPKEWNGLKLFSENGTFLKEEEMNKVIETWEKGKFREQKKATIQKEKEALNIHIKKILRAIDAKLIRAGHFKVAIDPCNGAGGKITQMLLKELGCKIFAINVDEDKPFPRPPEPAPENIKELAELVRDKKADIGFALDPDADRVSIVSERGKALSEEYTLALASDYILSKISGKKIIVTNLSTSMIIDDIARKHGARIFRTKIGEANVLEKMLDEGAEIGGEGNGGVIYTKVSLTRDSLTAIALILEYLARSKKGIGDIIASLPEYHICKGKIETAPGKNIEKAILGFKEKYKGEDLDLGDGVKVILNDSWIHVRPSNTEPIMRIITEARSKEKASSLLEATLLLLSQAL